MQLVNGLRAVNLEKPLAMAIGNFDGVHRGHRVLLGRLIQGAKEVGCQSAVMTFRPHPRAVLTPDVPLVWLTNPDQQRELLADSGVDLLIEQPFNRELAQTSPEAFVHILVTGCRLLKVVVGDDFNFGKARAGNVALLRTLGTQFGFQVDVIDRRQEGSSPISSSRIRRALEEGDVETAVELLGRPYELRGVVEPGDRRGRTIGFPTANVRSLDNLVTPGRGVYACSVALAGKPHPAATNIGLRPTIDGTRYTVEVFVLDFDGDLYGQTLHVQFLSRLREERKFDGLPALVAQIQRDVDAARDRWTAWSHQSETSGNTRVIG
jgi:riboflavin kinase/FMN adenylyltransferase